MPSLFARQNPLDSARNTFSSWDNCMAKAYCNGGGGRSGHKRVKSEPTPTYPTPYGAPAANQYAAAHYAAPPAPPVDARPLNQQYRSNAMPTFTPAPVPERQQYATFASPSKPVNEDALPAMPTWKDGRDVHVEVEQPPMPEKRGDMEMDRLDHNGSMTAMAAVPGATRSPGPGRSPIQRSPTGDGYGFPPGYQNDSFVGAGPQRNSPSPYGRPYAQQDEYGRGSPAPPVYAAGDGYTQNQSYGRRSPGQHQAYNQYDHQDRYDDRYDPPDQRYRSPSPPSANNYNYNQAASRDDFAPAPVQQRSNTPGYAASESTHFESSTTSTSAYPGQRAYSPQSSYPGQQTYQAFSPGAPQGQQYSGVTRKAVDGTHRDI
ncbi:hypothetical protein BKA66DRAFT_510188 [Pyrenochaeta sp. MPI-SDFR-AT-0127]|nr:hypothetical protein BKA66DRAFT_510188 [Pyrenochaeta sp. MPI-SDFR-AT-0127]